MKFVKMHSAGNDYIYVDYNGVKNHDLSALAQHLSKRRFSIGSDGLIAVEKISPTAIKMRMFNSDGSIGATCGNGVRCSALFGKKYLGVKSDEMTVITNAYPSSVKLFYPNEKTFAKANMGKPIDLNLDAIFIENLQKVGLYDDNQRIFYVNTGNLHLVCFTPEIPLNEIVKRINSCKVFENGINIERVESIEKVCEDEYLLRAEIFERGSGKTLSCGSGTVATSYAFLKKNNLFKQDVTVNVVTEGGVLQTEIINGYAFLSGEIHEVFAGEINI